MLIKPSTALRNEYTMKKLAFLIVFGILFAFFGCAPQAPVAENAEKTDGAGEPNESKAADVREKPLYSGYEFPEANLEGYIFRIYNATTFGDDRWTSIELTAESETGDPVNDAVYRRNTLIEEKFNIKFTEQIEDRDVLGSKVSKAVQAGLDEWDAVFVGPVVCAPMATKGMFGWSSTPSRWTKAATQSSTHRANATSRARTK